MPWLFLGTKAARAGMVIECMACILTASLANAASPSPCLPATTTAYEGYRVIYQEFPALGPTETSWAVAWTEGTPGFGTRGLWIAGAWFRAKPGANFVQVLGQSGLSQIFVPYHEGTTRLYDLNPWTETREAVAAYTGPCGTISGPFLPSTSLSPPSNTTPPRPILVKEIRDRGIAWTSDGRLHRGEELLLWSVIDTGNYEYIVQYGFRDDGTVTFRLGSTGYNNPGMPYEAHMHNALWYLDINLGQYMHNSVSVMKHLEPDPFPSSNPSSLPTKAVDVMEQVNNGLEGFVNWKAEEFLCLNIQDTLTKNAHGHNISYDLMPMLSGTARHNEDFSKHDFWVTQANSNELTYEYGFEGWAGVPYITPAQSIVNNDIVVWCMSSNHHQPRDEDHEFDAQGNQYPGIAQVMWSGFDLHPRNLMDDAPLHGCVNISPGPIAWWPFEESSGAHHVADIKTPGTPNNGVPQPGPLGPPSTTNPTWTGPTPAIGATGGALSFDGIDDYVEINNDPSLNFATGDFSVDVWIKASTNAGGVILDKRTQSGTNFQGYHLFLNSGKLGLQLANGTSYSNYLSNAVVADTYWHHAAVTVNRTATTKEIRWYVDGVLAGTTPAPLTGTLNNNGPLRLGARSQSPPSGFFKGVLGEIELYNRLLSAAEVRDIYASGKCR